MVNFDEDYDILESRTVLPEWVIFSSDTIEREKEEAITVKNLYPRKLSLAETIHESRRLS